MATTSTLVTFKTAIVAATATGPLASRVYYSWPGPELAEGWFEGAWLGDTKSWRHDFPNSKAGRKQRQETYIVELIVWVAKPDEDSQGGKATETRALALLAEIEDALADDVQLAATAVQWAQVGDIQNALVPMENGWGCMLTVDIEANARLT